MGVCGSEGQKCEDIEVDRIMRVLRHNLGLFSGMVETSVDCGSDRHGDNPVDRREEDVSKTK